MFNQSNIKKMTNTADYRNGRTAKEIYQFAKDKAKKMIKKDGQMIRLFADTNLDYYLVNISGVAFIGSFLNSKRNKEMNPFFKNKKVWFTDDNKMKLQELCIVNRNLGLYY
jgi:hypothetical protein